VRVRKGFVSNSSSMSFVARLDAYDSVFDLARTMLDIWMRDHFDEYDDRPLHDRDAEFLDRLQDWIDKLFELEDIGFDPNTPVKIPSINFDSWIVKKSDGYYCNTSNNHCQWEDLKGIIHRIHEGDDDDGRFYVPSEYFFYDVVQDIMIKRLPWREYRSEERYCRHEREDNRPYTIEKFMLESGEIVCRKCDQEKIDDARIIRESTR